jgi:phosphatidate cytidylyltransferase
MMPDLGRRTVTAVVYGAVVLAAVLAPPEVFAFLLGVTGVIALWELAGMRRAGAIALAEALVLAGGLASLLVLRVIGGAWLLLALVPTWAGDVVAYLAGSAIGRRKLAPRISPGKTWEGTIAGFVASAVAAILVAVVATIPMPAAAFAAVALGPAALAGDLLESLLKRRAGVKDSGAILPAHGGMLDRIDSLIVVAPVTLVALFVGGTLR